MTRCRSIHFSLLLAFCGALAAAAPALAETAKPLTRAELALENKLRHDLFYGALDASAQTGDVAGTLKLLNEGLTTPVGNMNPTDVAIQWLLDNTFEQADAKKINAFYFMVLADIKTPIALAFQQTGKDAQFKDSAKLALKALMAYEILAMADAERCGDPSVEQVVGDSIGPRYRDLAFAFKSITKEEFDLLGYYATELERLKGDRPVNTLLCSKGAKAKDNPMYAAPAMEQGVWMQKRTDLRLKYKNFWSKRYYEFQNPGQAAPVTDKAPDAAPAPHEMHAVPGVPTDMPVSPANGAAPAISNPTISNPNPLTDMSKPVPISPTPAPITPAFKPITPAAPVTVPSAVPDTPESSMPDAPDINTTTTQTPPAQ